MPSNLFQNLKNAWRNTNSATVGFLQNVPADNLLHKPFETRFTNYAWEFACIIRTRLCYLEELKTGIQNFEDRPGIPNKNELAKESKAKMLEMLSKTTNLMIEAIDFVIPANAGIQLENEAINSEQSITKVSRIMWLLQHERIHQGKLILYHAKSGYKIPESFKKTWGESNF